MKQLTLTTVLCFVLCSLSAQNKINYDNPELTFYITEPNDSTLFERDVVDLSKLRYSFNKEMDKFETVIPFIVREYAASQKTFWFFKHIPEGGSDVAWMIYDKNNKGICKSFASMHSKNKTYMVFQGQDDLNILVVPGRYTLKLFTKEIPKEESLVYLRTGISSKSFYRGLKHAVYLASY
ncbi:hypothetical protein [Niabella beijingensis]|uniref:hypothetical protein n=1 Tax=Niabella beijingensis TaxID=2872700 RepID=UPI001CBF7593|nr:hypothetical protein [Niabella beijingensis]MBZ4192468.1 hypothetical protein [Niabella beijingensis]